VLRAVLPGWPLGEVMTAVAAAHGQIAQPVFPDLPGAETAVSTTTARNRASAKDISTAFSEVFLKPEFWEKQWERAPFHHCAADGGPSANLFPGTLCSDDIADLTRRSGSSLKMFRRGETCSEENFLVAYLDGASLIINQAERYHPILYEVCRALAAEHFHHVFAVVYLTPPNSYAVRLHNDDQDVFLMQVWGSKHWKVRNAPKQNIYTEEMLGKDDPVPKELISEPIMSFDMHPGDILYIPRGFLHEATTTAEPSCHVTITMPTSDYCWGVQMVKHLMQEVHARDAPPEVRKACQTKLVGPDCSQDDGPLNDHLQNIFNSWGSNISVDGLLDAFEKRMARCNEGQERSHQQAMSLQPPRPQVNEECRVRLMFGVTCWCEPDAEMAVFKRDTQRLELPIAKSAAPLIRSLTARPLKVKDLPCTDTFERLCVLQLLHDQGVLQLFLRDADENTLT